MRALCEEQPAGSPLEAADLSVRLLQQEIGPRVASLWATKERLLAEVTRYQDEIRQGAKAFAELELQHTKLKFTPSATRYRQRGISWSRTALMDNQAAILKQLVAVVIQ